MKNIKILFVSLFLMFCCIPTANAGIPMPDGLRKLIEKIEVYEDKLATFQKDVMETVQENIEELQKAKEWAEEKVNKVKGAIDKGKAAVEKGKEMYENAEAAVQDPLGAGMNMAAGLAEGVQGRNFDKDLTEMFVYSSNLTYQEFQNKMKITNDTKRSDIADLYAAAFVRRLEMIDEIDEEKNNATIGNQQEPLKQQIQTAAEIARRFVSMIVFEAFTGKIYFENQLSRFSQTKEEDAEEQNGI